MDVVIRAERKNDYDQIQKINDAAFGRKNEGRLVASLRKTLVYNPSLSLVAEVQNKIVGHILFYPVIIQNEKEESTVLSLGPVAVHPDFQNKGIGSQLVKKGIEAAGKSSFGATIVLGHPTFYPRFGFTPASKWGIQIPFDAPDEAFLAVELKHNFLKRCRGKVQYPEEFFDAI
jgi:putative acetyltransferase